MKNICKNFEIKKAYPLSNGWISSKNFWNNKAAVIECKGGYIALQSYSTIVCVLYRGKLYRTWGGYSATTSNHINRFCNMNGLKGISKKEWENMEVFNTSIKPLETKFRMGYNGQYFESFSILYM